jgi:hypothetical protein
MSSLKVSELTGLLNRVFKESGRLRMGNEDKRMEDVRDAIVLSLAG